MAGDRRRAAVAAMTRDQAIDQAFDAAISQTGTDLVNPLENGPVSGPDGGSDEGADPTRPMGERTVPWMQPEQEPTATTQPTAPTVPPEQVPAGERPMPGVTPGAPVTRLNLATLPPQVQQYAQHLQREYDAKVAALEQRAQGLGAASQFADVAVDLSRHPELREHVRQWYASKAAPQQAAQPQDPLAGILEDPNDLKIVNAIRSALKQEFQQELDRRIQPVENERQAMAALREEQEFLRDHPDWQEYVSPQDLMRLKEIRPNEHLADLFGMLARPVLLQRLRSGGHPPEPQTPTVPQSIQQRPAPRPAARTPALQLHEIARRQLPPSQPRQQPAQVERTIRKGPSALGDAYDAVMERLSRG